MTKNILITAPSIYSIKLQKALSSNGFNIITASAIETNIVQNKKLLKLFDNIDSYDYIILPSRNAIKSFFYNANKLSKNLSFSDVKFSTIGNDENFLKEFGEFHSLKTQEPSTGGIVDALKAKKGINKIAVLIPKVEVITEPNIIPNFISKLKDIAEVDIFEAYITRPNQNFDTAKIVELFSKEKIDFVLFTSGGEIEATIYLLKNINLLKSVKIICLGPYTKSIAIKNQLVPFYTGKNFYSFEDFSKELAKFVFNK